jgi:hypothetical protein
MGREVKRVALDFDWPISRVWVGFVNPHYRECDDCEAGWSRTHDRIAKYIRPLIWDRDLKDDPMMRRVAEFLTGRPYEYGLFGYDSIAASNAVDKIGHLAGLPDDWRTCPTCGGDGIHPGVRVAYEAWEEYEPPAGDGWQMWETTSEGSPISPVCESPEALARWLADNRASTFGADTATYEQWLAMIGRGWAMSAVLHDGVMESGVSFAARTNPGESGAQADATT